ncbi:MAG: hypothetical protein V4456_16345 [Bacteroidota bacterium]
MAGKQLTLSRQVAASSILETVVAMVIIVVVFGAAMVILGNVMKRSVSVTQIRAGSVLREKLQQEEYAHSHENTDYRVDDLDIKQTISILPEQPGLVSIQLSAYDGHGKKIAELHKIISQDEN